MGLADRWVATARVLAIIYQTSCAYAALCAAPGNTGASHCGVARRAGLYQRVEPRRASGGAGVATLERYQKHAGAELKGEST